MRAREPKAPARLRGRLRRSAVIDFRQAVVRADERLMLCRP